MCVKMCEVCGKRPGRSSFECSFEIKGATYVCWDWVCLACKRSLLKACGKQLLNLPEEDNDGEFVW